jgi:hypothetical protein
MFLGNTIITRKKLPLHVSISILKFNEIRALRRTPTIVYFEKMATIIDYRVKHAMHKPDTWLNEMTDRVFHGSPNMTKQGNRMNAYRYNAGEGQGGFTTQPLSPT